VTRLIGQRRIFALIACIAAAFGLLTDIRAMAQQSAGGAFDHLSTSFPLTGAHVSVDCESCHVRGRFKGTPRTCAACHNGTTASGKSVNHAPTTARCDSCHTATAWKQVRYDHSQAIGAFCRHQMES
jgi:hypothetical protein